VPLLQRREELGKLPLLVGDGGHECVTYPVTIWLAQGPSQLQISDCRLQIELSFNLQSAI
jgi:hypothetical protein